jgi:hypothetical protein
MVQDLAHGDRLLAMGAELGPEVDDRRVVAEQTALNQEVRNRGRRAFDDREVIEGRARGDGTPGCRVGDTRDRIDEQLAVPVDRHLHSALGSGLDQLVDFVLDLLLRAAHDWSCLLHV